MIDFNFIKYCYSCGLCEIICPVAAIGMKMNNNGYFIPMISVEKCIGCNECVKICPHYNVRAQKNNIYNSNAYAALNKNEKTRLASSSGGIFRLLADVFIEEGDYVCGCVWNEEMKPIHIVSNDTYYIEKMMGAKYVQSDIRACYVIIKNYLATGKKVLFTGTPCQTIAMYQYIGEHPNFYTMTVICHGVSSPIFWEKYVNDIEEKHGKVSNIYMKDKSIGWRDMCNRIVLLSQKEILKIFSVDAFYQKAFIKSLLVKDRCLTCDYKRENIKSDLIVGDFWGLPAEYRYLDDDKGTSCVLTLNDKGRYLYGRILSKINSVDVNREAIFKGNGRIITPTAPHPKREEFINAVLQNEDTFTNLLYKYVGPQNLTQGIKYYAKLALKNMGLYKMKHKFRYYQIQQKNNQLLKKFGECAKISDRQDVRE